MKRFCNSLHSCLIQFQAQNMLHEATIKYERALSMQTAALEMVDLAEQGYERKKPRSDMAWKEMLHNATIKVGLCYWFVSVNLVAYRTSF